MVTYNKHDVKLLEGVYEKLKPWITNHPNVNILTNKQNSCPKCGSNHLQQRGYSTALVGKKPRYHCQSCGGWSSGKIERVLEIRQYEHTNKSITTTNDEFCRIGYQCDYRIINKCYRTNICLSFVWDIHINTSESTNSGNLYYYFNHKVVHITKNV